MEGFTFYKSFYETMKRIRKKGDRAVVALATLEYMFDDVEPQGLPEAGEIAFESFRRVLENAKKNAGRGGRPRSENPLKNENRSETDPKPLANRSETDSQPIRNRSETDCETRSSSSLSLSLRSSIKEGEDILGNKNIPCAREEERPLPPSKRSEELKAFLEENKNVIVGVKLPATVSSIDFKKLSEVWKKTPYLKDRPHDLKWICDNYPSIIGGVYGKAEGQQEKQKGKLGPEWDGVE